MRTPDRFRLEWRQKGALLAAENVPRRPSAFEGAIRFPDLATRVVETWKVQGAHRSADDARQDRAVLHASNVDAFEDVAGAMDAIHAAQRSYRAARIPAFDVVFAVD